MLCGRLLLKWRKGCLLMKHVSCKTRFSSPMNRKCLSTFRWCFLSTGMSQLAKKIIIKFYNLYLYELCLGYFKTTAHYKSVKISKFQCLAAFQGLFQKFSQNALDEWLQQFPDNDRVTKSTIIVFTILNIRLPRRYTVCHAQHIRVYIRAPQGHTIYAKCFLL